MTAEDYRRALSQLGFRTHDAAAATLGIGRRTSFRYAKAGAPKHIEVTIRALLGAKGK